MPFKATPEEVRSAKGNEAPEVFLHQSISCMDQYKNYSFEASAFPLQNRLISAERFALSGTPTARLPGEPQAPHRRCRTDVWRRVRSARPARVRRSSAHLQHLWRRQHRVRSTVNSHPRLRCSRSDQHLRRRQPESFRPTSATRRPPLRTAATRRTRSRSLRRLWTDSTACCSCGACVRRIWRAEACVDVLVRRSCASGAYVWRTVWAAATRCSAEPVWPARSARADGRTVWPAAAATGVWRV